MTGRPPKADFKNKRGSRRPAKEGRGRGGDDRARIFGLHAVQAALANRNRTIHAIHATANAAHRLGPLDRKGLPGITEVAPKDLDRMLGNDAVHQGVMVEAEHLPALAMSDLGRARLILFLDQITDPHNVGAILRSASAFGVEGLVMTARNSPPLDGVLAKAASGALDHVPIVLVPNLARALAEAGEMGFARLGLDSDADADLEQVAAPERLALVLGAEDRGLRRLTREHCESICALRTFGEISSLNVSNAAAISLHMMAHRMRGGLAV